MCASDITISGYYSGLVRPLFGRFFTSYFAMYLFSFVCLLLSGAIIFGSDQEVREVMRAVRRNNATGMFSWIGSDGWSARNLVSDGNEPEVSRHRYIEPY